MTDPARRLPDEGWLILGAGALGRLLAARLTVQGPVTLIGRRASDRPITLVTPDGKTHDRLVTRQRIEQSPRQPAMIHLATKAHAAEAALTSLADHLTATPPLVLWQNGYQVQEPLTRRWPGPVLCATTTEGAYTQGDDGVVHAGHGQTFIGHLGGQHTALASHVAARLNAAGFKTRACDDIRQRLWHKLAVNAAINPLVARFRIRNGQLRDRPFRPMVEAIVAEVTLIMAAEGVPAPDRGWSALVWDVVEGTASNRASMLQDVLAERPTERDAILGPLCEAAMRHGLDTPALTALWQTTPR